MNGTAVRAVLIALVLGCMLVTCTAGGGLYLWARQEGLNPVKAIQLRLSLARSDEALNTPAGSDPTTRRFTVNSGDSASTIAANLLADGLISDSGLFVDYVVYHRLDDELEAGTFFLQQTQTIPQIARALTDAASATIPFRTLEGWRLEEIAQVIDSNPLLDFSGADFLAVVGPGGTIPADFKARVGIPDTLSNGRSPSLEGFLYPGTYQLKPGITPEELRDEMLAEFDAHVTSEFYDDAAEGLTMYQVVTLASIVQKEAVDLDEAPVIASVYLNRFRLPMRLDADPTVQYALGNTRDASTWWPSITQADYYGLDGLPNQSYSTYLNEDLPPGPIAAPGLPAIRAVVQPAETQYYYFRRGCEDDNRHVFFTLDQQADHANFTCD
ncbi:endolytic transglycosylase MltG [Aggregatilinea lenta]|uniref:endolytic transglycosylase MltG n=1 Tax=Aggregatilinea lenta TaxID=913108 RepID=UPI0013C312A6|nr:endolytic transglycosylase MltG [Aggregatilinea lenta]